MRSTVSGSQSEQRDLLLSHTLTHSLKSGIFAMSSPAVSSFPVTASSSAFINIQQTGGNSSIIHGQVVFGVENISVSICVCEDAPGRKEGGSRGGGSTKLTQREFPIDLSLPLSPSLTPSLFVSRPAVQRRARPGVRLQQSELQERVLPAQGRLQAAVGGAGGVRGRVSCRYVHLH